MTVITKAKISEKKTDKILTALVSHPDGYPVVVEGSDRRSSSATGPLDVETLLSPSARRRVATTTTVCVFVTALLVMSVGIIGGVYLYRQHQRMSRFVGWCGIGYDRDSLHFPKARVLDRIRQNQHKPMFNVQENHVEWNPEPENLFKEEFDLDLDKEEYERIYVPDFGYGLTGHFIHDFNINKTGILDRVNGRCFVMPLDRGHTLPPRRLFSLIHKIWMGNPAVNTEVVRKTMQVQIPPLADLSAFGPYIGQFCAHLPTYQLREIQKMFVIRHTRSADEEMDNETEQNEIEQTEIEQNEIEQNEVEQKEIKGTEIKPTKVNDGNKEPINVTFGFFFGQNIVEMNIIE